MRRLNAALLAGIIAVPAIFGLLILRKGYERSLRQTVLIYASIMTGVGLVAQLTR